MLALLPFLAAAAAAPAEAPNPNPIALPVSSHGFFELWGSERDYLSAKYGHEHASIARRGMVERQDPATGSADLTNIGVSYTVEVEIG
jgi:hypothetical protein